MMRYLSGAVLFDPEFAESRTFLGKVVHGIKKYIK